MAQIPRCRFTGGECERGSVVDLTGHEYKTRTLRNRQHIALTQLGVRRCIGPTVDVGGDVDHHAASCRMALELCYGLFLLRLDQPQCAPAIPGANRRSEACC